MNELASETSPYLLQHAQNPVYWKAWNNASLELTKSQDKLLIISIGYSACHWCHVMEHETFEDEEAAQVMNANFVSIKIDREERPDIDAVYMKAVQIMTGHGGWPMNVVALPDGRPVWGGTYFKKDDWIQSLEHLQQLYKTNPQHMLDYAETLQSGLQNLNLIPTQNPTQADIQLLEPLLAKWKKSFDHEFGGMARAPKFMLPNNYVFLQRYGYQLGDNELLGFVDLTLTKMAYGGLFDTLGGGFSRYSVDMKWHVPHFEKMLYDNGQLVSLYADAYKRTQNPLYREIIEKTLAFVSREWLTPEGAFYSALDADSLDAENQLEEGAFYVWTKPELQQLLGDDFELFGIVFNINDFGFWEKEHYVLIQNESIENIAAAQNISADELRSKKKSWENLLFTAREKRPKPRLDDKCLTSWNAIMLKGFVDAYKALGDSDDLATALRTANFITESQWSPEGNLWHSFKNGKSTINGFLEDYAHVIAAFIALYEVTFDEKFLYDARKLTDYCLDNFYDANRQFFAFASKQDPDLVAPHFEIEDNVIPASNSVMAENLFLLGIYFEQSHYEKLSKDMISRLALQIDYPSAFSNWMRLLLNYSQSNKELVICGNDALDYLAKINRQYLPQLVVAGTVHAGTLPLLESRYKSGKTQFYLCQNKTCNAPTTDFSAIAEEFGR